MRLFCACNFDPCFQQILKSFDKNNCVKQLLKSLVWFFGLMIQESQFIKNKVEIFWFSKILAMKQSCWKPGLCGRHWGQGLSPYFASRLKCEICIFTSLLAHWYVFEIINLSILVNKIFNKIESDLLRPCEL